MAFQRALLGKSVLVTRPKAQSLELTRKLERLGALVDVAPAIKIAAPTSWRRLDQAIRRLPRYDTLIFTSANGVSRFFDRTSKLLQGPPPRPRFLYAIGPKTAEALRRHGWRGITVPEIFEGEALARRISPAKGRRILIPRARVARDILPKVLRRRGASVDVVEAYRTLGDSAGLRKLRRKVLEHSADIITFTSSSTVEHFMKAVPRSQVSNFFQEGIAASIGPITSEALRRHGVKNIVQARTFTSEGLVQAIASLYKK